MTSLGADGSDERGWHQEQYMCETDRVKTRQPRQVSAYGA